jgi:hypothetical protein
VWRIHVNNTGDIWSFKMVSWRCWQRYPAVSKRLQWYS